MKKIFILLALFCFGLGGKVQATNQVSYIPTKSPISFQKVIDDAYKSGLKKVVIPAGVYRLPEPSRGSYLSFKDMSDFEIDLQGVTLLRTDPTRGCMVFEHCSNVTLRGATLLNETPPFTQGTLIGIDPEGNWYDVQIDKGYPANFDDPKTGVSQPRGSIFDSKTRQFKEGTKDCFFSRVERLGADMFRLYFEENQRLDPKTHPAMVGDLIAFRGRGGGDITLNGCSGMVIDGISILSGIGFCIHETGGEGGNRYTSCKVTYAPAPTGAENRPLMACNADSFHSSGVRQGPIIENCLFEGMQDDGIPIHGSFALVVEAEGNGTPVTICGGRFLRTGDPICFYDPNGSYIGDAKITSIAPREGFIPKFPITNLRFTQNRDFMLVTLDKNLPLGFQYLASDPAANGSGYIIRNNTIRNHRARGMLLKAENGLVEGNIIEGSTIGGIVLSPEIWWNEAGYSRRIIIRNNIIRHVGYSTVGSSDHQAGAITVSGGGGEPDQIVPVYQDPKVTGLRPGHKNILIENNTIEDCNGVNLLLAMSEDVTVKNNQFIRPQQKLSLRGEPSGVDPSALIWVFNCVKVSFKNNKVVDLGHFCKSLVKVNGKSFKIKGVDLLKYDYCNAPYSVDTAIFRYTHMSKALKSTDRSIVFSICEWVPRKPWNWAEGVGGNYWRTTWDIGDAWDQKGYDNGHCGIIQILDVNAELGEYAGPGHWNDPDMLIVGIYGKGKATSNNALAKGCTDEEYRTHMSLWCLMASPLLCGNDLRSMSDFTKQTPVGPGVVAIDQEELGKQAKRISDNGDLEVFAKPMADGSWVVGLLNRNNDAAKKVKVSWT